MKLHIQSNAGGASPVTDANIVIDLEGVDSPITPLWYGGISQRRSDGNVYLVLNALIVGVISRTTHREVVAMPGSSL